MKAHVERPGASTLDFAQVARVLGHEARARGLHAPGFRCPPRIVGVDRSLRRSGDFATVAVRVKGRPLVAVVADMIEGVVVVNRLVPPVADRLRRELWEAVSSPHVALSSPVDVVVGRDHAA
ncbi:MAG: hypothetical protein ACO3Q4_10365 [Ilumatobacteraceae bacterium]|jgi:hypothetical protein|nr:hypothetical protein [Acidimicrobiia bacterium]